MCIRDRDNTLTLNDHYLSVAANTYLPTDVGGIPLGHEASLANSDIDYRQLKSLDGLAQKPSLDHNFCISHFSGKLKPLALLQSRLSGISMQLFSAEAGLQVYDAAYMNVSAQEGLHGRPYVAYSALALEPQGWPNAANESAFPGVVLHPTDSYSQHTRFIFDTDAQ